MATISKFYFHDAATTNTGIMPGAGTAYSGSSDFTGDGAGARTARKADGVIGTLQTSSLITASADVNAQNWGHRRFVSAPLAAQTFAAADGNWTFSYAVSESNANHNGRIDMVITAWRPSTGAFVGAFFIHTLLAFSGTTETAASTTGTASPTTSILDGDILVFEITDSFTQSMATAYTSSFFYDGTTEASITSCASFVTPPVALTLFTPASSPPFIHQSVPFYPRASRPS